MAEASDGSTYAPLTRSNNNEDTDESTQPGASTADTAPGNEYWCKKCDHVFKGNARKTTWEKHVKNPPNYCIEAQTRAARSLPTPRPRDPETTPAGGPLENLHRRLAKLKKRVFLPDHIPTCVRHLVAEELGLVLTRISVENSEKAWTALLVFWYAVVGQPRSKRAAESPLVSIIRRNLQQKPKPEDNCCENVPKPKKQSSKSVVKQVARKLQDGNVSGSVKVLADEEAVCLVTPEVLAVLQEKHPLNVPILPIDRPSADQQFPDLTADEIWHCIRSFPGGSAGGPDGMRPGYLKELLSVRQQRSGALIKALAGVLQIMLRGEVPQAIVPVLYGASLTPLRKKDGGIRPIAVGFALRRLASRVVARRSKELNARLLPLQLGFATKGGCETAVHAARAYVESNRDQPTVMAFLKIDIKNAFNCLDRNAVLTSAARYLPTYFSYIRQCYANESFLLCEDQVLSSRSGLQQGDPLGPLLYCLCTVGFHEGLRSELTESYLDDDVLAGPAQVVLEDFRILRDRLGTAALAVNVSKCEVFFFGGTLIERDIASERFLVDFPSIKRVTEESLAYLGSPLLNQAFTAEFDSAASKVFLLIRKAEVLPIHQALYLIKNCLGPVKVVHLLRSCRGFLFPDALERFDERMRISLTAIANNDVSGAAWIQASLPASAAGLGIRSVVGLALPAFLASAHAATDLCQQITTFDLLSYLGDAYRRWTDAAATELPAETVRTVQKAWDLPIVALALRNLQEMLKDDPTSKARLLAAATPESGALLNALPVASNLLDDRAVRIAIALRLGLPTNAPHQCVCGDHADPRGHHALTCPRALGRLSRHTNINITVKGALSKAGIFSELEPQGLVLYDGRRPDGMTMAPFKNGRILVWDATVVSTTAISHIVASSAKAGGGANEAEHDKILKYRDVLPNYDFVPLGFETYGTWGTEAQKFLKETAKRQLIATGEKRSMEYLRQRVAVEIQRGNAMCVLGTVPDFRITVF